MEKGECIHAHARLTSFGKEMLCLGTAFVTEEQDVPSKGRLLLFDGSEEGLTLSGQVDLKGGCLALATWRNYIFACISHSLVAYKVDEEEGIKQCATVRLSTIGVTLTVDASTGAILVGDLMRSVRLYQLDPEKMAFLHLGQDPSPSWTTSAAIIGGRPDFRIMWTNNGCEMATLQCVAPRLLRHQEEQDAEVKKEEEYLVKVTEQGQLTVVTAPQGVLHPPHEKSMVTMAHWHLGASINQILPHVSFSRQSGLSSNTPLTQTWLLSAAGSVHRHFLMDAALSHGFDLLQHRLASRLPSLGHLSAIRYRDRRQGHIASMQRAKGYGVIDGDLIRSILYMTDEALLSVLQPAQEESVSKEENETEETEEHVEKIDATHFGLPPQSDRAFARLLRGWVTSLSHHAV